MTDAVDLRAVGRHAVRDRLARVAFDRFCATGFERVTFNDLADATGVSRSTFLRYFTNKEDVVLFVFDPVGDLVAAGVRAADPALGDWDRLRHGFEAATAHLTRDADETIAFLELIAATPALRLRFHERQASWAPAIATALRGAEGSDRATDLATEVRTAAALECFSIALSHWSADGGRPLVELLDEAFDALSLRTRTEVDRVG